MPIDPVTTKNAPAAKAENILEYFFDRVSGIGAVRYTADLAFISQVTDRNRTADPRIDGRSPISEMGGCEEVLERHCGALARESCREAGVCDVPPCRAA